MKSILALLATLVASAASSLDIPYDGKNLHLNSQYRESYHRMHASPSNPGVVTNGSDETYHLHPEEKFRHYNFLSNPREMNGRVQVDESLRHNTLIQVSSPTQLADEAKATTEMHLSTIHERPSSSNNDEPFIANPSDTFADANIKGRLKAFNMFAVWSLDNLFWLIPFVASSPFNAVHFFITYQALVVVACVVGDSDGLTFEEARALNILWGGFSALLCWALAFLFYARLGLRESLTRLMKHERHPFDVDEETGHETPSTGERAFVNPFWNLMPVTTPTAFLTVVMTVMAAVDDLFFIPVVLKQDALSPADIYFGSSVAILMWICLGGAVAFGFRTFLCRIPLYSVLAVYASVMTGHSGWDFFASHSTLANIFHFRLCHMSWATFTSVFRHGN